MERKRYAPGDLRGRVQRELRGFEINEAPMKRIAEEGVSVEDALRILNAIYAHSAGAKFSDIKFYLKRFREKTTGSLREDLRILKSLGLVEFNKDGKRYRLTDKGRHIVEVARAHYPSLSKEVEEVYGWVRDTGRRKE